MKRLLPCLLALLLVPAAAPADSWAQTNQPLAKPDGWRQLVTGTPFALGEPEDAETPGGVAYTRIPYGSYPILDGSTVAVPMAMEFARQHLGLSELDVTGFVSFSTTHHAYENLIGRQPNGAPMLPTTGAVMDSARPVDLVLATAPSEAEHAMADAAGVTLVMQPVCHDAFVFITHVDNPVDSLTQDEIRAIYTRRVTNWAEVGGEDAEITAYQREAGSGSQTAMEEMVMRGEEMTVKGRNLYESTKCRS